MDLFQDFSFSSPPSQALSSRHHVIDEIEPRQDISPRSSRSSSPFSTPSPTMTASSSFTDLPDITTEPFQPYTSYPSNPISSRLLGSDRRKNAQDYFDTVRQRRQSAVRLQCNPRNAANIRSYVERFLLEEGCSGGSRHPSSISQRHLAPPTSAPMQDFTLESVEASEADDEDDEETEAFKALSLTDGPGRIGSDSRRASGSVASGRRRSYAVQKSSKRRAR